MRKIFVKSIVSLFIATLFLSVIFSFIYVVVENRSIILRSAGIYLKDDCKLNDFSGFSCSYISVSNRKDIFFNINDVSVKIFYKNILKNKPVFKINAKNVNGFVYGIEKKKRNKKKKISLKGLFYYLRYVNTDIKNINIDYVKKGKNILSIKNLSFHAEDGFLKTFRKSVVKVNNQKFFVESISGTYDEVFLYIKDIKIFNKNGSVIGNLFLDIENNIKLNGKGSISRFSKDNFFVKNMNLSFIYGGNINKVLKGNIFFNIKKVKTAFTIENIKGKISINFKDFLSGTLNTKAKALYSDKFYGKDILLASYFDLKNSFSSKNTLLFKSFSYLNRKLDNLVSAFEFSYKGFPYIKGKVFYKKVYLSYFFDKNKIFKIYFPEYSFSDITPLLPIKEKFLKNIYGKVKGKYLVDIKNKIGKGKFSFRKINLYGLSYNEGIIKIHSYFLDNKNSFNIFFKSKYGFFKGNGFFLRKNVSIDFSFDSFDIKNMIFTSRYGIHGLFSGKGKLKGSIPDLELYLNGYVKTFSYKELNLKNLIYTAYYKNSNLTVHLVDENKRLNTDINISLKPLEFDIKAYAKRANISAFYPIFVTVLPSVFNSIKPVTLTGKLKFHMKDKIWSALVDIKKSKIFIIPIKDFIYSSIKGSIKNKVPDFTVTFYKKKLKYKNFIFRKLTGIFKLKNKAGNLKVEINGLNKAKIFNVFSAINLDIDKKYINGDIFSTIGVKDYKTVFNTSITGNLKELKGVFYTELFLKNKKFAENFANYSFTVKKDKYILDFKSDNLDFFLNNRFEFLAENPKGRFVITKHSLDGKIIVDRIKTYQNKLLIFKTVPVAVYIKNNTVYTENLSFKGMVSGSIYSLVYNIPEEILKIKSKGTINKQILSEIIQFGTFDGSLKYSIDYNGKIFDLIKKVQLSLFSKNLKLRSSYLRGIMLFDRFSVDVKEGKASINIKGKVSSILSGDNYLELKGDYDLKTSENWINLNGNIVPVRYPGIFEGNITPKIVSYTKKEREKIKQFLEGKVLISGRLRLEKDIQEQFSKGKEASKEKKESKIKNTVLNITGKTFSPVYVYGSWGNAYMEGDISVKGTLGKPYVNGYINVIYGKINYLKNRYNIDFAKLKIIENEVFISARLSTLVANTFIYININGSVDNPKLTFTSIPPKSKNEILSILLLKDTPATLENIPLFSVVGKLFYMFLPFGTEGEEGLFNTGFNVMINPSYNPIYGITASIYARKNLTRRFYIAFSRPIKEVEGINIFGWYEIGANITEKTSFQLRWFENQDKEIQLMFSLPFDF